MIAPAKVSVFLGLLFCQFSLQGAEAAPQVNQIPAAAAPIVWPATGPRKFLGKKGARFFSAEVPVAVIKDARKVLQGKPSEWYVGHFNHKTLGGADIVYLKDGDNQFICHAGPERWVRLNTPESLPYLNELLRPLLQPVSRLANHRVLETYVSELVNLYEMDHAAVLSREFRKIVGDDKEIQYWLGTEGDPRKFKALFHEPVVSRHGDTALVRFNVLTGSGAVERWTVKIKVGKTVEIVAVSVERIRGPHTFNWPLAC